MRASLPLPLFFSVAFWLSTGEAKLAERPGETQNFGSFKIDLLEDGKTYSSNSMHFEDQFFCFTCFFLLHHLCFFFVFMKILLDSAHGQTKSLDG